MGKRIGKRMYVPGEVLSALDNIKKNNNLKGYHSNHKAFEEYQLNYEVGKVVRNMSNIIGIKIKDENRKGK